MRRYVGLRWSPKSFLHHQSFTATARIAPAPFCQKRNQPSMTYRDGGKTENRRRKGVRLSPQTQSSD